jgi:hypothetical protein
MQEKEKKPGPDTWARLRFAIVGPLLHEDPPTEWALWRSSVLGPLVRSRFLHSVGLAGPLADANVQRHERRSTPWHSTR